MADKEQGVHQIAGGTHEPGDLADQICVLIVSEFAQKGEYGLEK
jgi:hypothetical protein